MISREMLQSNMNMSKQQSQMILLHSLVSILVKFPTQITQLQKDTELVVALWRKHGGPQLTQHVGGMLQSIHQLVLVLQTTQSQARNVENNHTTKTRKKNDFISHL